MRRETRIKMTSVALGVLMMMPQALMSNIHAEAAPIGADQTASVTAPETTPAAARTTGHSLTLSDCIGVNFLVTVAADADPATTYMSFTRPNGNKALRVNLSDAVQKDGAYVFTCPMVAKEMADTIHAELFVNGQSVLTDDYAVDTYAQEILNGVYDAKTKEVVRTMLNYGSAAQAFFGYHTDRLANRNMAAADQKFLHTSPVTKAFEDHVFSAANMDALPGLIYAGSAPNLESTIGIRHFFDLKEGENLQDYTFTLVGNEGRPETVKVLKGSTGRICIEIGGIHAFDLDRAYTLRVEKGGVSFDLPYSVYTYCRMAQENPTAGLEKLKNVVYAMNDYRRAADELKRGYVETGDPSVHLNKFWMDWVKVNGANLTNGSDIDRVFHYMIDADRHTESLGIEGWLGFEGLPIRDFGYAVDGREVFSADFKAAAEQGVIDQAGKQAGRYKITVPLFGLKEGTHKVEFLTRLENGTVVRMTPTFMLKASENLPEYRPISDFRQSAGGSYRESFPAAGYEQPILYMSAGAVIDLGEMDLSRYAEIQFTYGCDGSQVTKDRFAAASSTAIGIKSESVSYGAGANPLNLQGEIAHTDMVYSGSGWVWGARRAVVDLTGVDYKGHVYFTIHNPASTDIAVSEIILVPKADAPVVSELLPVGKGNPVPVYAFDNAFPMVGGQPQAGLFPVNGSSNSWNFTADVDATVESIKLWGWVACAEEDYELGYLVDGRPVMKAGFYFPAEGGVIEVAKNFGAPYAARYTIFIDVAGLEAGTHTVIPVVRVGNSFTRITEKDITLNVTK